MSWEGFKKGWRDLMDPPYLRDVTPEQRAEKTRLARRRFWGLPWFWEALEDPPEARKRRNARDKPS